jgi:subtilisin family serine protease
MLGRLLLGLWAAAVLLAGCNSQVSPPSSASYLTLNVGGENLEGALVEIQYDTSSLEFLGVVDSKGIFQLKRLDKSIRLGILTLRPTNASVISLQFKVLRSPAPEPALKVLEEIGRVTVSYSRTSAPQALLQPERQIQALGVDRLSVPGASQADLDPTFVLKPLGDVNGDGRVSAADALRILRYATGQLTPSSGYERYHADLNSSGTISSTDALIALRKAVDPELEAGLEVAPTALDLTEGQGYVLVGNSGNLPLPEPRISGSPGLSWTDVTPEGARGYAYRVQAFASVANGAFSLDGGTAGRRTVLVNADLGGCPDRREPNDSPDQATLITPGVVNAGICSPGDVDFYTFTLQEAKVVRLEVLAQRLTPASPLDSVLRLFNQNGYLLLYHDDLSGSLDSQIYVALPAGTYYLAVTDNSYSGGNDYIYRLVFSLEDPVAASFEAQAGTLAFVYEEGDYSFSLEGNLFEVAAYQEGSGGQPLPYGVYVGIRAPNGDLFEGVLNHPAYGSPGYESFAYLFLTYPEATSQARPFQLPQLRGKGAREEDRRTPFRPLTPSSANARPQAILGGTFTLQVGTATFARPVDPTRKLSLPENLRVGFSPNQVRVQFDPVPGAVEYTLFVYAYSSGCFGIAQSTSPDITLTFGGCTLREGERVWVETVAANFRGLVTNPIPVPGEQMDASDKVMVVNASLGNAIQGTVSQGLPEGGATGSSLKASPTHLKESPERLPVPDEVLVLLRPLPATSLQAAKEAFAHAVNALALDYGLQALPRGAPGVGLAVFKTQGQNPETVTQRLRMDPRVRAASPNYPRYKASTPNDPYFPYLWGLWGVTGAPAAWAVTTGSPGVVVAVLDTGMGGPERAGTSGDPAVDALAPRGYHPDLVPNLVDGYDFVRCYDVSPWLPPSLLAAYPRLRYLDADDQCGPDPYPIEEYELDYWTGGLSEWGGHGTHVAGTVGAVGNNGQGVAGVNWQVSIQPIRVLGTLGGFSLDVLLGALYAAGEPVELEEQTLVNPTPARVINMSLGGPGYSEVEEAVYEYLFRERNVLVVAAAGNSSTDRPFYPAAYAAVMAVGSVDFIKDLDGDPSNGAQPGFAFTHLFSNYGPHIDIAAPGGICWEDAAAYRTLNFSRICQDMPLILSTVWRWYQGSQRLDAGAYGFFTGTSMASPHVAGAAALLLSLNPNLTAYQLREILRQTATDVDDSQLMGYGRPGRDNHYGWGVLNLAAAVEAVRSGRLPQHPVGAIWVEARNQAGEAFRTQANAAGFYRFTNLPDGTYTVSGWVDLNGNGEKDPGEPQGQYPSPIHLQGYFADNISFVLR